MSAPIRAVGIDPGTLSFDVCGLEDDRLFLDQSLPTAKIEANPAALIDLLQEAGPVDMIIGPSGYGVPWIKAQQIQDQDIELMVLSAKRSSGRNTIVGGLRKLLYLLKNSQLPLTFVPAVIHLPTVPPHRKVNRLDMGTADKLCAVVLGIFDQARRFNLPYEECSFIYVELGGAFTAIIAVEQGQIVDGLGGSIGSMGYRSLGAMDGELAYLLDSFPKGLLATGGAAYVAQNPKLAPVDFAAFAKSNPQGQIAWQAFFEGLAKQVAAEMTVVTAPREILVSGRLSHIPEIYTELVARLAGIAPVRRVEGFTRVSKEAAQGAALIANGLAGGIHQDLVETMQLSKATGTVLDHLYIDRVQALQQKYATAG